MKAVEFVGQDRVIAAPEDHDHQKLPIGQLPLKKVVYQSEENKEFIWAEYTSCWKPSKEELDILNEGGVVQVSLIGIVPPIAVNAAKVEILP